MQYGKETGFIVDVIFVLVAPLAHGVFGPFDELLPIALIVILAGLLVFTWWNGRKTPPPPNDPLPKPTDTGPAPTSAPLVDNNADSDESHFTVQ